MNRASPVVLRKSMEMVRACMEAGIAFVPMPVLDDTDHATLIANLDLRLEVLATRAEESES